MLLSLCLTPVSEDQPCGYDLSESEDSEYLNYTTTVPDRLPKKYITPGVGVTFDASSIKVDTEEKSIFSLLKRTRDLRLLVILAQFRVIDGDLSGFAECLEAMAALLKTWWNDVHPAIVDDDIEMREIALGVLSNQPRVIGPLNYLKLYNDRKLGNITLRQFKVANKPDMAFPEEEALELGVISRSVAGSDVREAVQAAYDDVSRSRTALREINEIWESNAPSAPAPNFDELSKVLGELDAFLKLGIGDDKKSSAAETTKEAAEPETPPERQGLMQAMRAVFRPDPARPKTTKIKNHAEAKAVLVRLEEYFQTLEPSSPSGLLVRQSRILIGRPLIEALEVLAPSKVDTVVIQISKASGFSLDAAKIRALSTVDDADDSNRGGRTPPPPISVETREDVFAAIQTVEEFLIETEPSSPVPMLLAQARAFMSKDFTAIMNELLEQPK